MGIDLPSKTHLGIEEVEVVVRPDSVIGIGAPPVTGILQPVSHVAILQVGKGVQPSREFPFSLGVDVEIALESIVVIILPVGEQFLHGVLHPVHQAEVLAVVAVPPAAQRGPEPVKAVVIDRGDSAIEVVVHLLLSHQVTEGQPVVGRQAILGQVFSVLVLLVVTLSLGVVAGEGEIPVAVQYLVPDEVVMLLMVSVYLVVIEAHVSLLVPVYAAGVVTSSIEALLILAGVVPGVISFLLAIEGDEFHHGVLSEISRLQEVGVLLGRSPVQVSLAADVGEPSLHGPVATKQSRAEGQRLLVAVVRARAGVKPQEGRGLQVVRLHVDGGSEGTRAVGAGARSSLYLHALHVAGEVAHVHPVHLSALRVVQGNAVGGDVDAAGVYATHPGKWWSRKA